MFSGEAVERLADHDGPELDEWIVFESNYSSLNGASEAAALLIELADDYGLVMQETANDDDYLDEKGWPVALEAQETMAKFITFLSFYGRIKAQLDFLSNCAGVGYVGVVDDMDANFYGDVISGAATHELAIVTSPARYKQGLQRPLANFVLDLYAIFKGESHLHFQEQQGIIFDTLLPFPIEAALHAAGSAEASANTSHISE